MKNLNGLSFVNLELTSRCSKECWMCGRRKIDKEYPEIKMNYGDIDFNLLKKISEQIPKNILISAHWNGDPLLYPNLGAALNLFSENIRVLDTNGILLYEKRDEIIGNLDTITISTFEADPIWKEQLSILNKFLKYKRNRNPRVIIRCLGDIGTRRKLYEETGCLLVNRVLHSPMGSHNYEKKVTIPEHGICIEALSHLAIDRLGNVSLCVRFDPKGEAILGNLNNESLYDIWNGKLRKERIKNLVEGNEEKNPICNFCDYWGIPNGGN